LLTSTANVQGTQRSQFEASPVGDLSR
jgi:hypothetical protein